MGLVNVFHTAFTNSCPRCHKGKVFKNQNPYNLKNLFSLHEKCSHCGLDFVPEVGFYYGAMYVSYALSVAWFVMWWILQSWLFEIDTLLFVSLLVVTIILLSPLNLRLSRLMWLAMFVKQKE
ncbi:MAG: DUF983 domain-containing protein [Bacteroidia bacterium]